MPEEKDMSAENQTERTFDADINSILGDAPVHSLDEPSRFQMPSRRYDTGRLHPTTDESEVNLNGNARTSGGSSSNAVTAEGDLRVGPVDADEFVASGRTGRVPDYVRRIKGR